MIDWLVFTGIWIAILVVLWLLNRTLWNKPYVSQEAEKETEPDSESIVFSPSVSVEDSKK